MVLLANTWTAVLAVWNWRALRAVARRLDSLADEATELPATVADWFKPDGP